MLISTYNSGSASHFSLPALYIDIVFFSDKDIKVHDSSLGKEMFHKGILTDSPEGKADGPLD